MSQYNDLVMRKASFLYLCFAVLLISVPAVTGIPQTRSPSVTDDCPYCQLYGQRFRTKVDLYLFQDTGEPHYKYFGVSNSGSDNKHAVNKQKPRPATLPRTISKAYVGHTYRTAKILDTIPAGSEFTVESATHEVLLTSGEHIGLMCRLFYNGKEVALVGAEFIQVHTENAQTASPTSRPNPDIDDSIATKLDVPDAK
jgi:hypothetical protein